ncbi:MAG: biotin/lipoyl-binding protein, partial [Oscillospiraceae bacterium]
MKKKKIIIIIAVAAAVLILILAMLFGGKSEPILMVSAADLAKGTIRDAISSSGIVESAASKKIYSTQNYPVEKINVEVGDVVKAGDVLCVLDFGELSDQIAIKEASMASNN